MTAVAAGAQRPPLGGLGRLLHAEVLKLRTTRTWWGLLIGMSVPMVALSIVIGAVSTSSLQSSPRAFFLLQQIGFAKYFVMVLGILVFTTEFRHNTATSTFLIATNRTMVVVAKLLAGFLTGLAYAAFALVLSLTVGLTTAAISGHATSFTGEVAAIAARMILVQALYGMLGVAVGSVLRNQVVAVVVTLGYLVLIEGIIRVLLIATKHTTMAAGLIGSAELSIVANFDGPARAGLGIVSPWVGGLIFVAYIAVFAAIGTFGLNRRDIA